MLGYTKQSRDVYRTNRNQPKGFLGKLCGSHRAGFNILAGVSITLITVLVFLVCYSCESRTHTSRRLPSNDGPVLMTNKQCYERIEEQQKEAASLKSEWEKLPETTKLTDDHDDPDINTMDTKTIQKHRLQAWNDYQLIITVKNMLFCLETQYHEFHRVYGEYQEEVKSAKKDKVKAMLVKQENMKYKSLKMIHLLKRFHLEIQTPEERYQHETRAAKFWRITGTVCKVAVAIIHIAGGNFAMITNGAGMAGDNGVMSLMENLAIAGNHIKDIDFLLAATDTLLEEGAPLVTGSNVVKDFTQGIYPLKYVREMIDQIKKIEGYVRISGMGNLERNDWNGVKMHLFRIFHQEQFIMRKREISSPKSFVGHDIQKSERFPYFEGTKEPKALVKRVIFKFKPEIQLLDHTGTHNKRYDEMYLLNKLNHQKVVEKVHCLKLVYIRGAGCYTGFIQLKEYTELSEVADLLGVTPPSDRYTGAVNPKHLNRELKERYTILEQERRLEVCEVRGNTNDILNNGGKVKSGVIDGQPRWSSDRLWSVFAKK
jgi:hypothetical protein